MAERCKLCGAPLDNDGRCVSVLCLRAQVGRLEAAIRAKDAALREHGGFHAPKDCGDKHRPRPHLAGTGKTCFYCEPALSPDAGKGRLPPDKVEQVRAALVLARRRLHPRSASYIVAEVDKAIAALDALKGVK